MTAHKDVRLSCDGAGCVAEPMATGHTAAEARRGAKAEGWKYRFGMDLCPQCAHFERGFDEIQQVSSPIRLDGDDRA